MRKRKLSLFTAALLTVACVGSQGMTVNAAIPCPQNAGNNCIVIYGSGCDNSSLNLNGICQSNNNCDNQTLQGQVQNYLQNVLPGCSNQQSGGNCPTYQTPQNTAPETVAPSQNQSNSNCNRNTQKQDLLDQLNAAIQNYSQSSSCPQNTVPEQPKNETPAKADASVKADETAITETPPVSSDESAKPAETAKSEEAARPETAKPEVSAEPEKPVTAESTAKTDASKNTAPQREQAASAQNTPAADTAQNSATKDTVTCNSTSCTDRTFTVKTYNGRTLTIKITGNRCTVIDDCKQAFCQPSCNNTAGCNTSTGSKNNTANNNQSSNNNANSNTKDTGTNTTGSNTNGSTENNSNNSNTDTTANASYAEQVVALVNAERAKVGLSALTIDTSLQAAAQVRAKEIETSFSHTRPDGTSFSTAIKAQGISYRSAGENIAYGQRSPEEVVNAWMNSEGHRANILNSGFTKIGVGYYQNSRGVNYWSQEFTN